MKMTSIDILQTFQVTLPHNTVKKKASQLTELSDIISKFSFKEKYGILKSLKIVLDNEIKSSVR